MAKPDPGSGGRGGGRRGGGKRASRGYRLNRGTGQSRSATTTKQDAVLTTLLQPDYDKAKIDALKIHTGNNIACRVNMSFATLGAMVREMSAETTSLMGF